MRDYTTCLFFCKVFYAPSGEGTQTLAAGFPFFLQPENTAQLLLLGCPSCGANLTTLGPLSLTNLHYFVCLVRCPCSWLCLGFLTFLVTLWPLLRAHGHRVPQSHGCCGRRTPFTFYRGISLLKTMGRQLDFPEL